MLNRSTSRAALRVSGVLALAALAACADDPTASESAAAPPAAGALAEAVQGDDITIEQATLNRFAVSVTAAGAFRPGVPVQIRVRTTAHLNSPQTALRVMVPELDAPTERARTGERVPRPAQKRSRDRWTASLGAGASDNHVTSVVFPRPGIYHVAVEATHAPDVKVTADGRAVQDAVGEMIELEVSERGVRARPARGPAAMQPMMIIPCEEDPDCDSEPPPPPPPSSVVWVWTAVWYSGTDMSSYEGVRRARVSYSGTGLPTGQTTTDEGGYALLPCNPANGLTNISVTLDSPNLRMTATHHTVSTTLDMRPNCYGGGWVAWNNWSEARAWDNLHKSIDGSRNYFGFSRGKLNARVGGSWPCDLNSSCYLNGSDEVLINPNTGVWGLRGVFVAAHEYGHAIHAKTPGGKRNCGGPHGYNDTSQDRCLALNEGFATYLALGARGPSDMGWYYSDHAADAWRYTCPGVGSCETRVTAFLLDLSEASVDPYGYGIQLPARHVFDMVGSCWLNYSTYDYEWQYTTSRWSQSQRNSLSEVWDCLEKQYPQHRGTMMDANGRWVDIILESISHNWAPLPEPTRSNVAGRLSR